MKALDEKQKEVVALLGIGTFLEYFDLMIYVHMAVLLNGLFYEPRDAHATAILSALTFSITFVFRPIGALIWGQIGDTLGRKAVLVLTTILMALSCLVMAVLPTFAQIGFTATIIMTLCRITQSISSTGEVTSSELYLMEMTKPPIQYPVLGVVPLFAALGGTAALMAASIVTLEEGKWRYIFWFGTTIAIIGSFARFKLKETPQFATTKARISKVAEDYNLTRIQVQKLLEVKEEKVNMKTVFALGIIQCIFPIYYYFAYIHCGNLYKVLFSYSAVDIIHQNLILSLVDLVRIIFLSWISYYVNPLKILKIQLVISVVFIMSCPFLLNSVSTPIHLAMIQWGIMIFSIHGLPAAPIFYKHIPILKRFQYTGLAYALGRAVMFAITTYSLVWLIEWYGNIGLLIIVIPSLTAYSFSLFYFDRLEQEWINVDGDELERKKAEARSTFLESEWPKMTNYNYEEETSKVRKKKSNRKKSK